jgi:hypothetical protein
VARSIAQLTDLVSGDGRQAAGSARSGAAPARKRRRLGFARD